MPRAASPKQPLAMRFARVSTVGNIKELEDFFRIKLVERHGKGIRLTPKTARNWPASEGFFFLFRTFQRGCLAQDQVCRIGGGATALEHVVLPVIPNPRSNVCIILSKSSREMIWSALCMNSGLSSR